MTKIQHSYDLLRKIDDSDAEAISSLHGYYGIQKVVIAPSLDHIMVEYDAARLTLSDVDNVMIRCGVPVMTGVARD